MQEPAPALPSGSLLDGEYDEAEQAASFAAAVAAWRTGPRPSSTDLHTFYFDFDFRRGCVMAA